MKKYLLLLSICGLLFSCKEKTGYIKELSIQYNTQSQSNLSSIIDTIISIPLETTEDCLLGNGFSLKRDNSLLFIEYDGIIYLFDTNGVFHKKITHKGNGPGEIWAYGYEIDKEKKELIVIGQGGKVAHYNYDGSLISEKILNRSSFDFREFILYDNSFWTVGTRDEGCESWILKFNKEWVLQDSIKLFRPEMPSEIRVFFPNQSFSLIDDILYVNYPSSNTDIIIRDTLYRIDGNTIIPELRIDYGNYSYRSIKSIIHTQTGYPIQPSQIRKTKRYVMTRYILFLDRPPNDVYFFYYDFITGNKYNLKGGFDDDIFYSGKVIPKPMDAFHEEFYFIKASENVHNVFPERDETENPVVFIFRLKE